MKASEFLTQEEQDRVVLAIKEAEENTSGEIRVHIDETCDGDPRKTAEKVFHLIGMDRTAARNGVLIYIACQSRVFSIIGDKGINDVVPSDFWQSIISVLAEHFSKHEFADGIIEAIAMTGEKLKTFFPYESDDVNEQTDEISFR